MDLRGLTNRREPIQSPITRSLGESCDYQPDWRFQVWKQYALEITGARHQSARLEHVLLVEKDPFVRDLIRYHFGRRCIIGEAIRYAVACEATNVRARIGSAIKAMIVAGRTYEQVASELVTDPL